MPDDDNSNDANQNPTPPAAPAPQPGIGTPAISPELQAIIDARVAEAAQKASNAAWAEARRTFEGKSKAGAVSPPVAAPPAPAQTAATPTVTVDTDALTDALDEFTFDKEQRREIRAAARRENPADVDGFVSKWARMFGKAGQNPPGNVVSAPQGAPIATPPPVAPGTPPVTSRATPPNHGTPTDDTPILSMSDSDRRALAAKIGDIKFAERMLKEMARDNVRVRPRLV